MQRRHWSEGIALNVLKDWVNLSYEEPDCFLQVTKWILSCACSWSFPSAAKDGWDVGEKHFPNSKLPEVAQKLRMVFSVQNDDRGVKSKSPGFCQLWASLTPNANASPCPRKTERMYSTFPLRKCNIAKCLLGFICSSSLTFRLCSASIPDGTFWIYGER